MKHRGEIVEKAIRQSGVKITQIAKEIGYNRKSIYDFFDNANLSLDVIVEIGKAIKYDFRKDFPELFIQGAVNIVNESPEVYGTGSLVECLKEKNEWKSRYYAALEENSNLKTELLGFKK
jgi:predicted transcriptional regulator